MRAHVTRAIRFNGEAGAPGDKSVSHRALIFSALSEGSCSISNLAPGADVRSTARCLEQLGVSISLDGTSAIVHGRGLRSLRSPMYPLDCGNSGTTMRLLAGVMAGAGLGGTLIGDQSLSRRPMERVLAPLRKMGARCEGHRDEKGRETAPLRFEPGALLRGCEHEMQISSAQVKSCLLLAGLFAEGETVVHEPWPSRDHTERMLSAFSAPVCVANDHAVSIRAPSHPLASPSRIDIPGDPSSAAFLVVAALIVPGGEIEARSVDVNPTRVGLLRVLARMGADIEVHPEREQAGDPVASLKVRSRPARNLRGVEVLPNEVPSLIDEIPILAILATQATGRTIINGAHELRVKESDRLAQITQGLIAMGARVEEFEDGLIIDGPTPLRGTVIDAAHDHRIAMSFAIAGLAAEGTTTIEGAEWADISFPCFFDLLAEFSDGCASTERSQ